MATRITSADGVYDLSEVKTLKDLREEIDLLERYIAHRSNPEMANQPFSSDYHLPKTYRGGFVRRLQNLLMQRKDGTFIPNASLE